MHPAQAGSGDAVTRPPSPLRGGAKIFQSRRLAVPSSVKYAASYRTVRATPETSGGGSSAVQSDVLQPLPRLVVLYERYWALDPVALNPVTPITRSSG